MFDIKKTIHAIVERINSVSFEVDGVKGRVFYVPLSEDKQAEYMELDDPVKQALFAATYGIAENESGESIADVYGEVVAVELVTSSEAPEGFVDLVADYVVKASGLDEASDDMSDLAAMSPDDGYSDEELEAGLNSNEFEQ